MQTTYSQKYKSMDCPVCGKPLIESVVYDKVACQDFYCKFNMNIHMKILGITVDDKNENSTTIKNTSL
jgi:hypothetical protein